MPTSYALIGARALDRRFKHERIHDGRQHAHGVAGRPGHALRRHLDASQHVATTDHHANRHTQRPCCHDIGSEAVEVG